MPYAPLHRLVDLVLSSASVKDKLRDTGLQLFGPSNVASIKQVPLLPVPAEYSGASALDSAATAGLAPIFITARFRSGSTFLWQIFKTLDNTTSYYEPLNEAQWFLRNTNFKVDGTHLGVDDYRAEYEGMTDLADCFDPEWGFENLYMDETHHAPNLRRYVTELIARAKGRAVLQFNRVDFRLPWLKAYFPHAKILHLYRHPREQWMSIVGKGARIDLGQLIPPGQTESTDGFYTLEWARDLRRVFPFLEPSGRHPYELHYLLWRLSYSFGKAYSDVSVSYEELVTNIEQTLVALFQALAIENADVGRLAELNQGMLKSRWKEYAPESWFSELEARCDRDLAAFFSTIPLNAARS
jgi:hypothetical protein